MPRPRLRRYIGYRHNNYHFKPQGIPLRLLKEISLSVDELESLRLKHIKDLDQEESAKIMKISRSTYQRILYSAYRKVTRALVNGYAIKIDKKME
ncbi:MAG: DUF134 domain-containing protein [Candidatus Pacebacteria bacterium]|nr:DUF134 domain-containing protein [Candidatus Paceibacterota bacterium]